MIKKIFAVAQEIFPNGVRADFIAVNKIKIAYRKKYGEEIPPKFDVLDFLDTKTFPYDGKVYFISAKARSRVVNFADKLLTEGNLIVFYESLYQRHRETFNALKIFSPELVAAILRAAEENIFFTEKFFGEKFFAINRYVTLKAVVEYILRNCASITLAELQESLPYVPTDELRKTLSDTKAFLQTTAGKFSLPKALQVDEREIESARKKFFAEIKSNGYAVLNAKLFPESFAANPELSEKNFCKVLFNKFFIDDFYRQGNILTTNGQFLFVKDLLVDFCARHDELSVNEVIARGREFDNVPSNYGLTAAFVTMTRVSKDLFVKDEHVHFDVDGTDAALNNFVQDKTVIALRDVTSFATFPPVENFIWNLYLLESFLRKFSRQFRFYTSATNNSLVGAICPRKKFFLDYLAVQSEAVAQADIPLDTKSVDDFLIDKGYRMKRIKKVTEEIIAWARLFREKRGS